MPNRRFFLTNYCLPPLRKFAILSCFIIFAFSTPAIGLEASFGAICIPDNGGGHCEFWISYYNDDKLVYALSFELKEKVDIYGHAKFYLHKTKDSHILQTLSQDRREAAINNSISVQRFTAHKQLAGNKSVDSKVARILNSEHYRQQVRNARKESYLVLTRKGSNLKGIMPGSELWDMAIVCLPHDITEFNFKGNVPVIFMTHSEVAQGSSQVASAPDSLAYAHHIWTYPLACVTLPYLPQKPTQECSVSGANTINQVVLEVEQLRKAKLPVYVYLLGFADKKEQDDSNSRSSANIIVSKARVQDWDDMLRGIFKNPAEVVITQYWFGQDFHLDPFSIDPNDLASANPYVSQREQFFEKPARSFNRRVEVIISTQKDPPYVKQLHKAAADLVNRSLSGPIWEQCQHDISKLVPKSQNLPYLLSLGESLRKAQSTSER